MPFLVLALFDIKTKMVEFSKHLEQVCRTNLFKFPNIAVRKIHVFRALIDSIFDALLCVLLIYHTETLVWSLSHLEKVSNSNLFEFPASGNFMKNHLVKHLGFLQLYFAKTLRWLVVTSKAPHHFCFEACKLEKHLK